MLLTQSCIAAVMIASLILFVLVSVAFVGAGLFLLPSTIGEREAIQALVTKSQETVNGEVRLKLYKGNVMYAGRRSPQSLYSEEIATMEGGHEELYNQNDAEGFIHLNGLRLKQFSRVNKPYGN